MNLKLEWKLSKDPIADFEFAIVPLVAEMANEQMPDLAEMFPLKGRWEGRGHIDENWVAVRVVGLPGSGIPHRGELNEEDLSFLQSKVTPFEPRSHAELFKLLGHEWFSFDRFTYVGPYQSPYACWPDVNQHLVDWLNHLVIPEILRRNETRVLRAIPRPPAFDLDAIRRACWVLECDQVSQQGTAFNLEGVGLITCQHVLGKETVAIHPSEPSKKYPVEVLSDNETIDLAIIDLEKELAYGLPQGTADNMKQMDHIAVAGFPNYQVGDTGVITPGLVVGFRIASGVRRILTNAPIVRGVSGGPVIGADNKVIGLAVTGAERMEESQETEKHGIIPIDALKFL